VKRSRGKPQLREFERVRWYAKALQLASRGEESALAALMALDGGLRSSEITGRVVRDIDRGGALVVVERGKTESSGRSQELSPEVAHLLKRQIAGRPPDAPLFPEMAALRDRKMWLIRAVTRICKLAGVPRVTPHGLRGTSATQGLLRVVLQLVSTHLGHAHTEVTRQHYISPEGFAAAERLLARAALNPITRASSNRPGPSGGCLPKLATPRPLHLQRWRMVVARRPRSGSQNRHSGTRFDRGQRAPSGLLGQADLSQIIVPSLSQGQSGPNQRREAVSESSGIAQVSWCGRGESNSHNLSITRT
jgi:hypothetical protein